LQKGESKYLFESPTKPVTFITSLQQDIVDDNLASTLEFIEIIHKENVANEIRQRNRKKKLQCEAISQEIPSNSQNIAPTISYKQKKEQGLIYEISADHDFIFLEYATEILLTLGQEKLSIFQNITHLYEKACDAEYDSIKINQVEILCWSNFIIVLDKSLDELMVRNKVSMKKAKSQVYDFIIAQNSGIRHESLYKKIERARKIYRLFEKIGLDKDNSLDDLPKTDVDEKTLLKIEKKLSKKMRNLVINKLTSHFIDSPKLDKNNTIDTEGEHQTDSYWVL
ncbi:15549_t:CDS:2, partial [Cetraspora pellucida]